MSNLTLGASLVEGAARVPLPFGLFSLLTFRTDSSHWQLGVQWETATCEPLDGRGAPNCDDPSAVIGLPKNLDPNLGELGQASPFTVYGHFNCSPTGWSPSAAQDEATAQLTAREEARVEQAFWTGDLGNYPNLDGSGPAPNPTELAGGSALPLDQGLALLEDYLSGTGSLGVIHMTRGAAIQAAGSHLIEVRGGRLSTIIGTPVVAGAGYPGSGPGGSTPGEGMSWAYATPAIFGYRSEVFTSSNRPGDLFDRAVNDLYAVAERSYLLGFDPCGHAAVKLELNATSTGPI